MNYHNITKCDMLNGDGLRVVLWVAGCSHHCKGCQNPQTWDCNSGIPFTDAEREEIMTELNNDWCSGLTFSGGDPLFEGNLDTIWSLIADLRQRYPNKTFWLYTGFTWEEIMATEGLRKAIVSLCDVIVDGRYVEEQRDTSLHWKGSANQRVIDVQRSISAGQVVLKKDMADDEDSVDISTYQSPKSCTCCN